MRCCPSCHRVWSEANEFCPSDGTGLILIEPDYDPLVGLELDERYRLKNLIGSGGMGFVYEAEQIGLNRVVAVKMLFAERTRDPQSMRRFRREAVALAGIDHPGVVRVVEYGDGGGSTPYIVMDLVHGRPLDEVIHGYGLLPPRHAAHVCIQLADALAAAHGGGVIHRDLKPANIQVDSSGKDIRVRILDFGLALLADAPSRDGTGGGRLTRHGVIFGTPEYMSPEQIHGEDASAASDLYSLGILLYELLTGTPPFVGPTSTAVLGMQIADDPPRLRIEGLESPLERSLNAIVRALLEKEPADRPQDAATVASVLRKLEPKLPDPGPPADLLRSAMAPDWDGSTLEIPQEELKSDTGPRTGPVWSGLTRHRDADLALESALSSHGRKRRIQFILGGAIGLVLVVAGLPWILATFAADEGARTEDGQLVGRLPPLTKVRREDALKQAARGRVEAMPGGEEQQRYEASRRDLARDLRQRGLRAKDLRAHPDTRPLWASQDASARDGQFASAAADLRRLRELAEDIEAPEIAELRLRAAEQSIGEDPDPLIEARLRMLRAHLPITGASADSIFEYMEQLDRLEEGDG